MNFRNAQTELSGEVESSGVPRSLTADALTSLIAIIWLQHERILNSCNISDEITFRLELPVL